MLQKSVERKAEKKSPKRPGGSNLFKSQDERPKLLPLKSLKQQIEDICESKIKFDEKCRVAKQPVETMEQYLYTYLNQKYGLKSLVIDWVTTIINSVNVYSHDGKLRCFNHLDPDPDVVMFGRILKNECEEG